MYGWFAIHRGDGENAIEHFQNAIRHGEEAQILMLQGNSWSGLGWGHYLLEQPETALKDAETAVRVQSEVGAVFLLSIPYRVQGMAYLKLGDPDNARRCMEESLKLARDNNEIGQEGISSLILGKVLGMSEEPQYGKAEELILQGMDILDRLKLKPYWSQGHLFLGELYADTGQTERAVETLKTAKASFQEMGMDYYLRQTQEVLERVEG
jgi:tetratricopeptide (TPR) repeat protein